MRRYIWSNLIYDQDGHSEFADMYLVHVGSILHHRVLSSPSFLLLLKLTFMPRC